MSFIWQTLQEGLYLVFASNSIIWSVVIPTLLFLGIALGLALLIGIPLGAFLATRLVPGKRQTPNMIRGTMGIPPVLVGILTSLLLWPGMGPLSFLQWWHTPIALVLTYTMIILPIIVGFTITGIQQLNRQLILQFTALGASRRQLMMLVLWEIRLIMGSAVLISSSRILSDVGASLMTGGNISGSTQVIATVILEETIKGNLDLALALGLVLLISTVIIGILLALLEKRRNIYDYRY